MTPKRPRPPLDDEKLRGLALHYAGRYATSRAKLLAYLRRKLTERGWQDERPADPEALVARFADLGYVDDAGFATMKGASMTRRGYGIRRVEETLRGAGIEQADRAMASAQAEDAGWTAAETFARRKRLGPFASQTPDQKQRQRQIAAFLRAGHGFDTARKWVDAPPGQPPDREE